MQIIVEYCKNNKGFHSSLKAISDTSVDKTEVI